MKTIPTLVAVGLTAAFAAPYLAQAADTPAKAAPAMQKVLDTLGTLGGKPIENLSPEEALSPPTATRAARSSLVVASCPWAVVSCRLSS